MKMQLNSKKASVIVVSMLVLTAFFSLYASKVSVRDNISSYVPKNDPDKLIYDEVADRFGLNGMILTAVKYDDVYKHFDEIYRLTETLKKLDVVDNVISPVNAPRISTTEDGDISVGNLKSTYDFSNKNSYEPELLKKELKNDEMIKGKFISENGKSVLFAIGLKKNVEEKSAGLKVENVFKNANVNYYIFGTAIANREIEEIVKDNLLKLIPIVLILVMGVLYFSYKNIAGVLLPIISVLLADIWTVGIMELLGIDFNITTSAVPIAVVGIGTAYSIHIISKYYEELHRGISAEQAVNETLKHVGTAVILSAFTTIAGFLSLLTADLTPVWQLGIFTSLGIALALLMATVFVPSMLIIFKPKSKINLSEDGESHILKYITEKLVHHRSLTLSLIIGVVLITTFFIPKIKSDMQIENFMSAKTNMVQSSKFLRENFGGNDYIFVDFLAKNENNFRDFYFNRAIRDVSEFSKNYEIISQVTNIGDVVANLTEGFTGIKYIPGSNSAMEQDYMLIEGSEGIDKILSEEANESISQMMVNTKSFSKVKIFEKELKNYINENILTEYTIKEFDIDNPEHVKAFGNEIKEFIISRKGKYISQITDLFIKTKKINIENIINELDKNYILKLFNKYLEEYGEEQISIKTFENYLNGKEVDEYISEYYEYFIYDYEPTLRANYIETKLKNMDLGISNAQIKELSQYVNDEEVPIPGGKRILKVRITGIPVLTNKVNDMVFENQKESMILAYVLVFILFALQMHSIILGLLALIPITLTIIVNFGIMGITGISLNAATVTIASITIGTGIDYTIHYLTRFKKEYRLSKDKFKAAVRTSATSGRAIVINSFAVILGFATFIFSEIGMLSQFGILTATAMLVAPILTLTIFPILMTMLNNNLLNKFSKDSILKQKK
ncbi:RND family transporter [Marinitoga sp. 1154]|uniref:efflux RND transporter permease subunit n=1 Tax=Marinitoga sp. 1154 TaxID=1643335 RepID=UPI001586E9BA|nr:MMPL family transporter [Marinitoga sp. 1154]